MRLYHLTAKTREKSTKGTLNQLKASGFVPAVIYGKEENTNVLCFINDLNHLIYTNEVYKVLLKVGDKEYQTVIKEIQSNPLTDRPIHIDFMEVDDNQVVNINYPVQVVGLPIGVRQGGKLFKKLRHLRLKGKISDMPDKVEVDVSDLDIGNTLKVKDIQIPNIQIIDSLSTPVISVARLRVIEEAVVAEGAEGAEGTAEGTPAAAKPEGSTEKKQE